MDLFTMKKIITSFVVSLALVTSATVLANGGSYVAPAPKPASPAAIYLGISGGYGQMHWRHLYDNFTITGVNQINFHQFSNVVNTTKENGFAGRVYLGFDFNRYIAIETGYTYLPKTNLVNTYTGTDLNTGQPLPTITTNADIKSYVVDFFLKVSYPIYHRLSVFAKAGGAFYRSTMGGDMVDTVTEKVIPATFSLDFQNSDTSNSHFGPAFGVGAEYQINRYLSVDAAYLYYDGNGTVPNIATDAQGNYIGSNKIFYQPSPDVFLAGIRFRLPTDTFSS